MAPGEQCGDLLTESSKQRRVEAREPLDRRAPLRRQDRVAEQKGQRERNLLHDENIVVGCLLEPDRLAPPPAPATPAPAPSGDFTVYFDFDSWTLNAEDLTVLTNVINTARTGGQAHITIVGHTDTSGPADYNQKLSVHRANVVVEALVDMGARRNAIQASGVGETDLAVQTPDGVKEAKNRRAVITLQP